MLKLAHDDIDMDGMMPEELETQDISHFSLNLNVLHLPEIKLLNNSRAYDHFREQGKMAFHLEVAKADIPFFKFLANHMHKMKLDIKYFGKFSKLPATLGNNVLLNNCMQLRRCIQGHLNFHLSSTSTITILGIDNLDATETLKNVSNGFKIAQLSLQDMLYRIHLTNKSHLFLQLSQCTTDEADTVIPDMPEAELMAKQMNVQIAAWCHFYWEETNPGGEKFYRKLLDQAFSQVLLHEISECVWDAETRSVTLPTAQLELSAVMEFKNQDWVKSIAQLDQTTVKKKHVDLNVVFSLCKY